MIGARSSTIRPVAEAELEQVLHLWEDLLRNGQRMDARFRPAADPRGVFRPIARDQWLRTDPFPHCLVAVEGSAVGFVAGFPRRLLPVVEEPPTAMISDVYVHPDHRRRGLASALVEDFRRRVRAAGYADIEVGTLALDERAVAFWRAQGFGDWRVSLRREV